MKRRLPGFSESNWTSGLKCLAGFNTRREGLADFEYRGEMDALKSAFKLRRNEAWEIAYIEVKSSVNTENFFHLSHGQFERVGLKATTNPIVTKVSRDQGVIHDCDCS